MPKTKKHNVPIEHFDYAYIKKCSNVKELEKILKVLRSGEEGVFPDLEKCAEDALTQLNPESKLLRKCQVDADLNPREIKELMEDMKVWSEELNNKQDAWKRDLAKDPPEPIRGKNEKFSAHKNQQKKTIKPCTPRDYKDWNRVDIDAELAKVDERAPGISQEKPDIPSCVSSAGMTDEEKVWKADQEKNKGNEAFRAQDYEEAVLYYNRSLSLHYSTAAQSNRAQAYIKLKCWDKAVDDCSRVLLNEPDNIKALFRRATAYHEHGKFSFAKPDYEHLLQLDEGNKKAAEGLAACQEKLKALPSVAESGRGRRIQITDVDSDSEGQSDEMTVEQQRKERNQAIRTRRTRLKKKNEASQQAKPAELNGNNISVEKITVDSTVAAKNASDVLSMKNVTDERKYSEREKRKMKEAKVAERENRHVKCQEPGPAGTPQKEEERQLLPPGGGKTAPEGCDNAPTLDADNCLPDGVRQAREKACASKQRGQYGDAVELYCRAIRLLGQDADSSLRCLLLHERASLWMKLGDCGSAITDASLALLCSPSAGVWLIRATAYETKEKYEDAVLDYESALQLDPQLQVAREGIRRCIKMQESITGHAPVGRKLTLEDSKAKGNLLVKRNRFAEAVHCYQRCLGMTELADNSLLRASLHCNMALCHLKLNEFRRVLVDCSQCLALDSRNVKALFRRALAYKNLGNYESSAKDLQLVMEIDGNNVTASKELNEILQLISENAKQEHRQTKPKANNTGHARPNKKSKEPASAVRKVAATNVGTVSACDGQDNKTTIKLDPAESRNFQKNNEELMSNNDRVECQGTTLVSEPAKTKLFNLQSASPYEFMQLWNVLGSSSIESYVHLLQQLPPNKMKQVISNKLDGDMLSKLIRCLLLMIKKEDKGSQVYEYLQSLSHVPRFNTIVMFLSSNDKTNLQEMLKLLVNCADTEFSKQEATNLFKLFCI